MGMYIVTAVLASAVLLTMVLAVGTELLCNPFQLQGHFFERIGVNIANRKGEPAHDNLH